MIVSKLNSSHIPLIIDHIMSLSEEDKRLRFGYNPSLDNISTFVETSFGRKGNRWFGVAERDQVVATALVALYDDSKAELGLTVDPAYRNQKLGQSLFSRGLNWARACGSRYIFMQCLSENKTIQHIAQKNKMVMATLGPGEKKSVLEFQSISLIAPFTDVVQDQIVIMDMIFKNHNKALAAFLNFMKEYEYE